VSRSTTCCSAARPCRFDLVLCGPGAMCLESPVREAAPAGDQSARAPNRSTASASVPSGSTLNMRKLK
jgi:hypothetical protein